LIFLTVGTEYPFDRLVRPIDEYVGSGQISDQLFAQVGLGGYAPKNMQCAEMLTQDEFDHYLAACSAVISHAGMGTIIRCIEIGKPLLVMPRLSAYSEVVNDHQLLTAKRFADRGDILVANDESEIAARISDLRCFVPTSHNSSAARVIEHIETYLLDLERSVNPKQ
jgi:UDP-N-acetylglucosamine transferase subunit ALG13